MATFDVTVKINSEITVVAIEADCTASAAGLYDHYALEPYVLVSVEERIDTFEDFIQDCEAFNNTRVIRTKHGAFVDTLKNLDGYSDNDWILFPVYRASNSEQTAAWSGEGQCSTFKVEGKTTYGHVYQILKKPAS